MLDENDLILLANIVDDLVNEVENLAMDPQNDYAIPPTLKALHDRIASLKERVNIT